jgi:aldehyde dehydrogenase (NAD+)
MQNKIPKALITYLIENENLLKNLNKQITGDTDFSIKYDYDYILKYLEFYSENCTKIRKKSANKLKPKGKILIILSYNEPFVMSIVPIINALIAGNDVIVKPSRKALNFFKSIWQNSGVKEKMKLKLTIFEDKKERLNALIPEMDAVYFFGSYKNATKLASKCAENLVEFYPEIEAADCKIVYVENPTEEEIANDIKRAIHDSFLHTGQSCQRIQGILVNDKYYEKYREVLKSKIVHLVKNRDIEKYIPRNFKPDKTLFDNLNKQLEGINKGKVLKFTTPSGFPYLIDSPPLNGDFIKSAQFLPTLWILGYRDIEVLINILNSRKYRLGINIICENESITEKIIESTKFSRYTVNSVHAFVRYDEGWGGIPPTGYNGYKSWIENFSYPYTIISN